MRKLATWGLEVALVVGLGVTVAFAGDDAGDAPTSTPKSWFGGWFGSKDTKETPKKADPKAKKPPEKKAAADAKPVPAGEAQRAREEAALLRRLAVCDRLMEIAVRTNDNDLLRRAEQLDERVRRAYSQRTARTPGAGADFESDEQLLDKHLGAGSEMHSGKGPASGDERTSRTAAREEEIQ